MQKQKIGILTLFEENYNYGGILQACALCRILNDMGKDCKVLLYSDVTNPIYPSLRSRVSQYTLKEIINKFFEKINAKFPSRTFKHIFLLRKQKSDDFIETYIPHTGHYDDKKLMKEYDQYDILISGSDQVWNPNCARIGFLQMLPHDTIRKVSYAASIGRNQLSNIEKKIMLPAINDFDFVAVRENTAKDILEQEVNREIFVTIDPTLLIEKNIWDKMCVERIHAREYVLCYFFSDSRKYREQLKSICREKGLDLLYIPYAKQEFNQFDLSGEGIMQIEVGPAEFLTLFKHATYIFTDSFHGTVFSLVFQKEFWVLDRTKESAVSMNSRLKDLLKEVKLTERNISDIKQAQIIDREINYAIVNSTIEDLRKKSLDYLLKATEYK